MTDNSEIKLIIMLLTDTYVTGVMADGEVGGLATGLRGLGLQERSRLAQVVVVQLFDEGGVSGFREHRLFLKDGEDTHGLKADHYGEATPQWCQHGSWIVT